jgi:hypothetical protein
VDETSQVPHKERGPSAQIQPPAACCPRQDRERVDNEALAIKAFRKVGYGQTVSRIDVKSHRLWLEEDPRVKPGERAIGVKQSRLFHRSQVEVMTEAEKKEAQAKLAAKTADKLPKVSPITEQAPQAKASRRPRPARSSRSAAK